MVACSVILFQIPHSFGACLFDASRTQILDEGHSECWWQQRCFLQIKEGGADLEQLNRCFGIREITVSLFADDQRISGDTFGFWKSESDLPIAELSFFIALC